VSSHLPSQLCLDGDEQKFIKCTIRAGLTSHPEIPTHKQTSRRPPGILRTPGWALPPTTTILPTPGGGGVRTRLRPSRPAAAIWLLPSCPLLSPSPPSSCPAPCLTALTGPATWSLCPGRFSSELS
jgi:hypothetical protein